MDLEGDSPWADAPPTTTSAGQDDEPGSAVEPARSASAAAPAASSSASSRPSRMGPRRLVAQPTRLEAVDDDPLGPLGAAAAGPLGGDDVAPGAGNGPAPPVPPQKEQLVVRTTMPAGAPAARQMPSDPHRIEDDDGDNEALRFGGGGPRVPPPVQAAVPSPVRSSTQPSMSIEQAAKPRFTISVGDPHKVGDMTSSHIVYAVRTRVRVPTLDTTNPTCKGAIVANGRVRRQTDHLQGVQAARVRRAAAVPRLPLALQHTARQQPGHRRAAAAGEAGGGAVREQLCRGAARGAGEDAQQDGGAPDAAARRRPEALPGERVLQHRRQAQRAPRAQPRREQGHAEQPGHQRRREQQVCRAG